MSALTKIFVVLHVIVSLMLAAGLIVFVNRQENYKVAAQIAQAKQASAERATALIQQDAAKVSAQKSVSETELASQITALNTQLTDSKKKIDDAAVAFAGKAAEVADRDVQITSLTAQVGAKDAQNAAQIAVDVKLQAERDDILKKYSDDERKITSLTNERDVVRKHDKYMAELYADIQDQLTKANEAIRKYNVPVGGAAAATSDKPVLNVTPNVNLIGVVRDFRMINGVAWATISIGSADAVTRGMEFKVVDGGKFLGYLTIDAVNTHDATGYMKGPAVAQVRPNVTEVRTQLD